MRTASAWVGVAVLVTASTALAEGPVSQAPHVARASAMVRQAAGEPAVASSTDADGASDEQVSSAPVALPAAPNAPGVPRAAQPVHASCGLISSCGYHRALAYLVITHDMDVPGAPGVAIRLLPTSHSLAGDSNKPIVVRPVVTGGGYGLDIAARF